MENNSSISIILIDESELDLLIIYQAFKFTHSNYKIMPFSSHTDAIDFLDQMDLITPDIIIIDAKTLHLCKYSFLSYIESNLKLKRTPILVLTSIDDEEICFAELNLPQNCFIEKPFSISELPDFKNKIEDFWSSLTNLKNRLN